MPEDPSRYAAAFPGDRKSRLEGGGNLHRTAKEFGLRRYIRQASGFFRKARGGLADESSELAIDASRRIAAGARMYAEIEARVLANSGTMEGVALRYGFLHPPSTPYSREGAAAEYVRRQDTAIIGAGASVWSFIHVEDAAVATVAALTAPPGVYKIVDDDPSPVSRWLPAFARYVGAPPPPHLTADEALQMVAVDAVYYGPRLSAASNAKARRLVGFNPRRLEWLTV